jgi:hypothetical protein
VVVVDLAAVAQHAVDEHRRADAYPIREATGRGAFYNADRLQARLLLKARGLRGEVQSS